MSASPRFVTPVPAAAHVLTDLASSNWLKDSLESALERDPVDALNDALLLASVLDAQLRAVLGLAEM
jgi:hypothetical protein